MTDQEWFEKHKWKWLRWIKSNGWVWRLEFLQGTSVGGTTVFPDGRRVTQSFNVNEWEVDTLRESKLGKLYYGID
jgi:hypothetical protein